MVMAEGLGRGPMGQKGYGLCTGRDPSGGPGFPYLPQRGPMEDIKHPSPLAAARGASQSPGPARWRNSRRRRRYLGLPRGLQPRPEGPQ